MSRICRDSNIVRNTIWIGESLIYRKQENFAPQEKNAKF